MYNNFSGEPQVFDFDEFADHLLEQGLQASPAELHGCLCGLLAAGAAPEAEAGLASLNQSLDMDLHGELADQIMQLYTVTAASLLDEEFDFHPLLPDDSAELAGRTAALAGWCRGFLAGFAQVSAGGDQQPAPLTEDSSEILKDFAAIAQAEVVDEEDDDEEVAENSYAELVEYLRFAALNVYMDTAARAQDDKMSKREGPSLH
jgi:uncharacterized protein